MTDLPPIDAMALVDHSGDGIWVLDSDGVTIHVNEAMAAMLGFRVDELVGRPALGFVAPDDVAEVAVRLERRRAGVAENYPTSLVAKDGRIVWCLVSGMPSGAGGTVAKLVDVSELHAIRDELVERRAQLRTAAELQDGILQRLVLAKYALDAGDAQRGHDELLAALGEARRLIGDLMAGDDPRPGALRRTEAAEG